MSRDGQLVPSKRAERNWGGKMRGEVTLVSLLSGFCLDGWSANNKGGGEACFQVFTDGFQPGFWFFFLEVRSCKQLVSGSVVLGL